MRRSAAWMLLCASAFLVPGRSAHADDKGEVVVTVGDSKLSVADIERRLRTVPVWQRGTLGTKPPEIRRHFVEKVLIPELLYAEEAKHRKLESDPAVHDRLRELLRQALENQLRETVASDSSVSADEVKAYYQQNLHRFHTPRRIKLWRILVGDEALAKKIISEVKGAGPEAAKRWTEHARQSSLDKATALRDGNLGFVHPDGQTEAPRVRVEPALFAAADKVKDGEIVAEPVKEGERWAVVWRRGSMEEVHRTLQQEEGAIRQVLKRKKLEDATSQLIDKLKKEQLKGVNEALLDYVEVDPYGDVGARKKPGVVPRGAAGSPTPKPGERGTR
jgi:peptidyl-prolyl cis-trans isomerase C